VVSFSWKLSTLLRSAGSSTASCHVVISLWQPFLARLFWKEVGDFDFQGRRQRSNDQQGGVALTPFQSPNIGPVVLGTVGKLLLAPATFLAECPQSLTKSFLNWLHIDMKPLYSL
jgi:hypothetical protein